MGLSENSGSAEGCDVPSSLEALEVELSELEDALGDSTDLDSVQGQRMLYLFDVHLLVSYGHSLAELSTMSHAAIEALAKANMLDGREFKSLIRAMRGLHPFPQALALFRAQLLRLIQATPEELEGMMQKLEESE